MKTLYSIVAVALSGLFLAGCGSEFTPGSKIERERVLGARSEVAGDPSRAWPMPGETTQLSWLVADPAEPKPLAWTFAACVSATGSAAAPMCADEPFAIFTGTGAPGFPLVIPGAAELGEASVVLVTGVVCANGTPVMDASGVPACEGDEADATLVTLSVHVQRGAEGNANPDLSNDDVTIDGAAWPETAADPLLACDGAGMPVVETGSKSTIGLTLDEADRELFDDGGSMVNETLQLSHFATSGRLERQFSILEAYEDADKKIEVEWKAPAHAPEGGRIVRVHLVLRDRRGGLDWTSREVCVVP